ncbi:unnamed protein product [Prunus armeniaca]
MNIQGSFLVCQKNPSRWFFNLGHTLQFGIGLHHAGLNDKDGPLREYKLISQGGEAIEKQNACHSLQSLPRLFASVLTPSIQKKFTEEFAERKLENDTMTNFGVGLMPLFLMDGVLPFQKFPLPIFEPRYGLMVIIDSSRGSIADFACEVEITKQFEGLLGVEALMPSLQDPKPCFFIKPASSRKVGSPTLERYKRGIALFSPLNVGNFKCMWSTQRKLIYLIAEEQGCQVQ